MSKLTEETEAWIRRFESGKAWVDTIQSPDTKRVYLSRLRHYCEAVGKNPDELIELKVEGLKNINTPKEFQAERLLQNFLYSTDLTDSPKIAIRTAVFSFYEANWRNLNPNTANKLSYSVTKQRTPKLEDLIALEENMISKRDKAIVWFLASSPVRVDTLSSLV